MTHKTIEAAHKEWQRKFDRQHKVDLSDVRQRLTNANSPGLYVPTKTWQRPGSDHSHIKSRGAI